MDNIIFLSFALFLISIYFFVKTNIPRTKRAIFSILVFISIVFYLLYFIADYFTGHGIDMSVIYHLKYGLGGAGFLEYWKLIIVSCFFLISGFLFSCWMFFRKSKHHSKIPACTYISFFVILLSLIFNPGVAGLYEYYSNEPGTLNFYKYYKQPYINQINHSKNLIFIYTEGLEQTYFNKTIFPGLTKNLHEIQVESIYFTNIAQVTGTGWTIGGIVASQCGIPLFTPSHGNSMSGMDKFLGSAVCLGDLLHEEDYHLAYYGGADKDFAGKGKFLETHKFNEIYGREELLPKFEDNSYSSFWGLYDDSLFELTYKKFAELSETKDKFALFLLTLDTHHPEGHPSKNCENLAYKNGKNPMLNAVACSDYLISDFINKIISSPYSDQTVIVLVSDHLALENTASEILNKENRGNLFMIITPENKKSIEVRKIGSTLDISPTILPFIGYNGEIGLGRNLLGEDYSESEIKNIQNNLSYWNEEISGFWDFPKIKEFIEVNLNDKTANIDNRIFEIPVFIEFNDKLETKLKFYWGSSPEYLSEYISKLDGNNSFLLLDECENVKNLNKGLGSKGFCLVIGNKDEYYGKIILEKEIRLTIEDIKDLREGSYEK